MCNCAHVYVCMPLDKKPLSIYIYTHTEYTYRNILLVKLDKYHSAYTKLSIYSPIELLTYSV